MNSKNAVFHVATPSHSHRTVHHPWYNVQFAAPHSMRHLWYHILSPTPLALTLAGRPEHWDSVRRKFCKYYVRGSQIKISNKQTPNIFLVEYGYCVEVSFSRLRHSRFSNIVYFLLLTISYHDIVFNFCRYFGLFTWPVVTTRQQPAFSILCWRSKKNTQHNTKEQTRRQIQIYVWSVQSSYRYLDKLMPHI